MRMLLADAHVRLLRAMRQAIAADRWFDPWLGDAGGAGPALVIEDFSSEPWASLTFTGMRHRIDIRLEGRQVEVEAAYDRLRALMTEPDLELAGHFLAEIELSFTRGEVREDGSMAMTLCYEALTIEE
mgnify:CR=1 FL=1|jgi:hypothetical protein